MVTTAVSPEPVPAPVSSIGRIFGVLFNPKPTFQSIARKPTWVVPLLVLTVISFAMDAALAKRVDWAGFVHTQLEKSGRWDRIPEDQKQQTLERAGVGQKYSMYVRGVIGDSLLALIVAAVYLAGFNLIAGADLKFGTVFSIVVYTLVPMGIKELLATLVIFLKETGTVDPLNVLASNVGAFLPSGSPTWLLTLGIALDIFAFWGMALAIVGFSAANPKKIKVGTAAGIVIGTFLLFLALGVGLAAAFS
jgi:hypothetical protein